MTSGNIIPTAYDIPGYEKRAWKLANVLSPEEYRDARRECLAYSFEGRLRRSETPSKREYVINTEFSLYIAYRSLPVIEGLLNQSIKVLHTFTSLYDKDDRLEPHVDRPPLDWTMSIMLGEDTSTGAIRELLSLGNQGRSIKLTGCEGDAVLFAGRDIPHWRAAVCENRLMTLLIHYGPARRIITR